MDDPTPALFISMDGADAFRPRAVQSLTAGEGRASVWGPFRRRADTGYLLRIYGPGIPAAGRFVTNGELARLH